MDQQKIFFSYSRQDASDFALKLYNDLQNAGADVWIDQLNMKGGGYYNEEIEKALQDANCVLFIVSKASINSRYILAEVYYAVEEGKNVIPIITFKCKLPLRIRVLEHIDFTDNYETGLNKLLKSINIVKTAEIEPKIERPEQNILHIENNQPEKLTVENKKSEEVEIIKDTFNKESTKKNNRLYNILAICLIGLLAFGFAWLFFINKNEINKTFEFVDLNPFTNDEMNW